MKLTRPLLRWHGGKWKLAPWIISHMPTHRIYVEPFGGAASVLLRKPRSYAEVYNDLDGEIVNVFRVLREPETAAALLNQLRLTPFARDEFEMASGRCTDPIEDARRLIARSFMGFGSNAHNRNRNTGFRSNSNRSGTTPARDWANYPDALCALIERLNGVVIENRDATEIMLQHDRPETLHYLDPPYVHSTRSPANPYDRAYGGYAHELTDEQHVELLRMAQALAGLVMISGYRCELYDTHLADWQRIDRAAHADGARDRIECLWLNAAASEKHHDLFVRAA